MRKQIRKILHHQLAQKGYILEKSTAKDNIIQLIDRLHPYQTEFDLIRIGPNGDGGYLVPDDLNGIDACFSPGVGKINEFELACLKYGMKIYMADKSVDKPNLNVAENQWDFKKKFVGCFNSNNLITMDDWVKSGRLPNKSELLLQMDIEGSEYNSIINMSDSLIRQFRIMIIEFHYLDEFWNKCFFDLAKTVFDKILQSHICVHIHPNNYRGIETRGGINIPPVAEFTFIRKDRVKIKNYQNKFPHPLDQDNCANESIILPSIWYKSE